MKTSPKELARALYLATKDAKPAELQPLIANFVAVAKQHGLESMLPDALASLPDDIAYVFIHDCARPLVRPDQLVTLHKIVRRENAVVLAHRVTDTIKEHTVLQNSKGRDDSRLRTLDRSRLWAMETPQVFSRDLIVRAYTRVAELDRHITDDAAAVEMLHHPIALLENPYPNPKLTTPADLAYLEFLLTRSEQ